MNIVGIIPARMASSRFPGKPMAEICGVPMIGHVYLRSRMCDMLTETYVATCDKEIADYIISIGGRAVMTSESHQRASDRTAEAVMKIERDSGIKTDIVVMIQGDEPLIYPDMIKEAVKPVVNDSAVQITNLMAKMDTVEEFTDPNEVKVVVDRAGNALYFSREPIPSMKKGVSSVPMMKQVCVIPFRRDFLLQYTDMAPTPLEVIESVDMMRILENGMKVRMVLTSRETKSVDTPADLAKVGTLMKDDVLFQSYRKR